jgi:hypothetical protein
VATTVLVIATGYTVCLVKEVIEIRLHYSNFNKAAHVAFGHDIIYKRTSKNLKAGLANSNLKSDDLLFRAVCSVTRHHWLSDGAHRSARGAM